MKKVLFIAMFIILSLSLIVVTFATDTTQTNELEKMTSILHKQLSEEEKAKLYNKDLYKSEVDVENKPIIKVYDALPPWLECELPLNELLDWAETTGQIKYVVLNENNVNVRIYEDENGIRIVAIETDHSGASYAEDLKSENTKIEIFGKSYTVESIHCFDDLSSHGGFFSYYVTDNGTFVRYYETQNAESVWFTESDFAKYGAAYKKHVTSYEHNYNENGEPLLGKLYFLTYIDSIFGTDKDYGTNNNSNNQAGTGKTESNNQSSVTDSVESSAQTDSSNQSGTSASIVSNPQNKDDGSSNTAIVLSIVFGALGVAVIIIVAVVLLKKSKSK